MPRWIKSTEELPGDCEVGDRIVMIVAERRNEFAELRLKIVIIQATEDGWESADDGDSGFMGIS